MNKNVFAEMEEDAIESASSITSDEQLAGIAALVQKQLQLEEQVANADAHLKDLKAQLLFTSTKEIPEAVQAGNLLKDFTTADGIRVEIKPFVAASITEEKKPEAFAWLRDHNFGDLIKVITSVDTGRDLEAAETAFKALKEVGLFPITKDSVHAGTLKVWLKEQVEAGTPVPLELFGAYLGQKTTIKKG